MIWFKACPRCKGDLYLERETGYSDELACLSCGYRRDVKADSHLPRIARSNEKVRSNHEFIVDR